MRLLLWGLQKRNAKNCISGPQKPENPTRDGQDRKEEEAGPDSPETPEGKGMDAAGGKGGGFMV